MDKKEYKKEYNKQYYQKNKEYMKLYYQHNKEKFQEYRKNNPEYRKKESINNWKRYGVISEDQNILYNYYLSIDECQNCGKELNQDVSTKRCLDHDHNTGQFRQILCNVCNIMRDKKFNELGRFI